ncbi:MAG: enoyl-CoA hydratase/isomerase family protein [Desulfobacterales bacterium]|nr:enoyl-CoA hydratase/isomerase family protein [Desulfobacterales bacterium]
MITKRIEDQIVIVTLSNGKTNAITAQTLESLHDVIKEVNFDDSLKGIILTGEGKFLSSGFDLPMFLSFKDLEDVIDFFQMEEEVLTDLFICKKPVICAINGHSVAGGLIFSMACDYRIVKNHPKIKIGMSEIKIGLPLSIAQHAVVRFSMDSDKNFRNLLYFGEMVDINKAKELHIIDEIVEEDQLIPRAKQLVSLWIDTPNRPFIPIKYRLKIDTVKQIRQALKEENWQQPLECFFQDDVRRTLEFVQKSMLA